MRCFRPADFKLVFCVFAYRPAQCGKLGKCFTGDAAPPLHRVFVYFCRPCVAAKRVQLYPPGLAGVDPAAEALVDQPRIGSSGTGKALTPSRLSVRFFPNSAASPIGPPGPSRGRALALRAAGRPNPLTALPGHSRGSTARFQGTPRGGVGVKGRRGCWRGPQPAGRGHGQPRRGRSPALDASEPRYAPGRGAGSRPKAARPAPLTTEGDSLPSPWGEGRGGVGRGPRYAGGGAAAKRWGRRPAHLIGEFDRVGRP